MYWFAFLFLSIYGAMHAYAYAKIRAGRPAKPAVRCMLGLGMLTMLLGPLMLPLAPKGLQKPAAWLVYNWMGLLLIFVSLAGLADLSGRLTHRRIPARALLLALLSFSLGLSAYAWLLARGIQTEQLVIRTAKLPVAQLRIVQISDVHLGLMVGAKRLDKILAAVRQARPDLLVSTGDLLDSQLDGLDDLAAQLAAVPAPGGKFAVLGNHEFYAGSARAVAFSEQAGFRVLENTAVRGAINIVGLSDPAGRSPAREMNAAFEGLDPNRFTLLLKHQPTSGAGLCDLQLSGHTHAGQIWPFGLLTRCRYAYNRGLHRRPDGSLLYVSRGSGTWGPQLRLGARPEIMVIDLVRP